MTELANPQLTAWANFYTIVGSSGAALIGMQFVVITLIADMRPRPPAESINAFGTPTVVHLAGALVISIIMSIPWTSLFAASLALALCGFGGLTYGAIVIRRTYRQKYYKPTWDDWFWYQLLPCGVYATLAIAAFCLRAAAQLPLFIIGASALSLLLIGIRNAWDSVIHLVVNSSHDDPGHSPDRSNR